MTRENHIEAHKKLHISLDKLIACWIGTTGRMIEGTDLMEFMKWSYSQTETPACFKE